MSWGIYCKGCELKMEIFWWKKLHEYEFWEALEDMAIQRNGDCHGCNIDMIEVMSMCLSLFILLFLCNFMNSVLTSQPKSFYSWIYLNVNILSSMFCLPRCNEFGNIMQKQFMFTMSSVHSKSEWPCHAQKRCRHISFVLYYRSGCFFI